MSDVHHIRIAGVEQDPQYGPHHTYGLRVELDGQELQGVLSAHAHFSKEAFGTVTLVLKAEVEVDEPIQVARPFRVVLAIADALDEDSIRKLAAQAVGDIAVAAARKNYLQVKRRSVEPSATTEEKA